MDQKGSDSKWKHGEITNQVISLFFKVYNGLGYGFLERVYENALVYELARAGLEPEQQKPLQVYYDGHAVGEFFADIIVANKVILELKAVERLTAAHSVQRTAAELLERYRM